MVLNGQNLSESLPHIRPADSHTNQKSQTQEKNTNTNSQDAKWRAASQRHKGTAESMSMAPLVLVVLYRRLNIKHVG